MKSKNIFRYHILSVICLLGIFILCVVRLPQQDNEISIPYLDKIVHFVMYFVFSLLFLFEKFVSDVKNRKNPLKSYITTIVLTLVIGGLIEIIQSDFTSYRSGEIMDLYSDVAGAVSAIAVTELIRLSFLKRGR